MVAISGTGVILRLEPRADFEGLELHMADWRPWQRYVRRSQAEAASGVTVPETILPRHVAEALVQLPGLIARTSTRTQPTLDQAQSLRMLCRLLYRVCRGGRIAALEGELAQAPALPLAALPLPALDA